jgi:uncharacterized protein (TIGR00251 family)
MDAERTTFLVRVQPRAKRNAVTKTADGSLKVHVTAPPEDGRANEAVVETIAEWLGVKRRQVEIIRGATNRNKVVAVTGVSPTQIKAALNQCR